MRHKGTFALVVGGSFGLGLEISRGLQSHGAKVFVTGRRFDSIPENITPIKLDITGNLRGLECNLDVLLQDLPRIDLLVYAAGFYESGTIGELSDAHIAKMINVGLTAPALLLQRLLKKQDRLEGLIMVTSTSQWIARQREPVYTAVKAGSAMLAQSLSLDPKVGKVLVAGPAGMNTGFWLGAGREDLKSLLSPEWVAQEILSLWEETYDYRLARILRDPARVEVVENR
jgi:NAD(P)-dependent dehydrogenase (short-subunit alcohol dehydrogenase family)